MAGSTSPKVFYLLLCRECGCPDHPLPTPFESAAARGTWASEHTRATGHDQWWMHDQPDMQDTGAAENGL